MTRNHWPLGIMTMLATGTGLILIGEPCSAQGLHGPGGNQGAGSQGAGSQGARNQGARNQGAGNQGAGNQGAGNQGAGNQGAGNQGAHNQGASNQGAHNQAAGNQGTRNQGAGNQGAGNQGAGNQGAGNQGAGNHGARNQGPGSQEHRGAGGNQGERNRGGNGFGNFGGNLAPQAGIHPGGGGLIQNQGIRPSTTGGNQPVIRVPNGINLGNGLYQGPHITPNNSGTGVRSNGVGNPTSPNYGFGNAPGVVQNAINQTVRRPSIGNVGNIENRSRGNNLNGGVGLYQPAYTRHSSYHGNWNGNRSPAGGFGNNNGFNNGFSHNLGGSYGISNGNWGYSSNMGNLAGSNYGRQNFRPLGWGLGGWGLGALIYNSGYLGYSNPYFVNSGASAYNYSLPIPVAYNISNSIANEVLDSSSQILANALAAFKQNNYAAALDLINRGISQFPDDAVLHELRSLIYFAQGDYQNAAGTIHSVLAVGPGWDWTTLISMYPDVVVYTTQLRTLELFVRNNPEDAASQFLLAYQYLCCGHADTAAKYLDNVVRLMPSDRVALDLQQMLATPNSSGLASPATTPAPSEDDVRPSKAPTFQNEAILGTWQATRDDKSIFTLTLDENSHFTWSFTPSDQVSQSFEGNYLLENDILSLNRSTGGTLVASLSRGSDNQFQFKLVGAPKEDPGLMFEKR